MTNVIQFQPRKAVAPIEAAPVPTGYREYWITGLLTSLQIAAYVAHDKEAVTLLIEECHKLFLSGRPHGPLPPDVRNRCFPYLEDHPDFLDKMGEAVQAMY